MLAKLSKEERDAFFNLSYVNFPKHLDPDKHQDEVALAIFQTNAVAAGDGVGIFPRMARINHGCSSAFNAVYTWREKENALYVHALKNISQGQVRIFRFPWEKKEARGLTLLQELLTSYTDSKRSRHHRRYVMSFSPNVRQRVAE